jgi:hypothetical protein
MNNNLKQAAQYFSLENLNRELYNTSPGDFMSSEDLKQHLEKVMEVIRQADCFNVNPFEIPSPENHSILSVSQPIDFEKDIDNKLREGMNTANNFSTAIPEKEVLMEPCTVNQPMNESLRKNYSKGSFYFLK